MIKFKLNQKGEDSASDVYRLLIAFVLAVAILVIIMNMINSIQKQSIIISNQKLKEGVQSAVKSAGTSATIPFIIEDLMLSGNIAKTTFRNYSGLAEECMAFVYGPGLEPINDDINVLKIKGRYIEMDVWAYCNFMDIKDPPDVSGDQINPDNVACPAYCVFFFNKKPDASIYETDPNTLQNAS